MTPVAIDFAWRPSRLRTQLTAAFGFFTLCALGGVSWEYWNVAASTQAIKAELNQLQAVDRSADPPVLSQPPAEMVRAANRVIGELDRPWNALLSAVENAATDQATLLAVEPDPERRELRIQGEAKDGIAAVNFVRSLANQPALQGVYLVNHQVILQDSSRPVRFSILAAWTDSGPSADSPKQSGSQP